MKTGKFLSPYIRSESVKKGGAFALTVTSVEAESVGNGEDSEEKLVLYGKEVDQGLVLNKTALRTLEEITGSDDTDDWVGAKIEVYFDPDVLFSGKRVGGLRVRAVAKKKGTKKK